MKKKEEILKKYQYKFYSSNIEELPEPITQCPLSLIKIEPKETHTATLIFLHGLGVIELNPFFKIFFRTMEKAGVHTLKTICIKNTHF